MRNFTFPVTIFALAATNTSQAAFVSISHIVTNNTLSTKTYDFSAFNGLGVPTTPAYMRGSVSVVITDFNRDGVTLSSNELYTAWINSAKVQTMPSTSFTLTAPARGNNTYNNSFDWQYVNSSLPTSTGIELRLNFTLSPGDQAAVSGTFEVSSVPTPAGVAVLLSSVVMLARRRRNV